MNDLPMMPKATAVWLVENTGLTFDQIAAFCGLHPLEVQAIADGEVAAGMAGLDPVASDQLEPGEIERCEKDPAARLKLKKTDIPLPAPRAKGARYTPVSKRQDKPDGIAWLLRTFPELSDAQIGKLLGTTKPTIQAIRDRTHWNAPNIRPRDPVDLGLCSRAELDDAVRKARRRVKQPETVGAGAAPMPEPAPEPEPVPEEPARRPEIAPTAESVFGPPKPKPEDEQPS